MTRLTSVGIRLSETVDEIWMQTSFCFDDKDVRELFRDSQFANLSLTRRLFIFDIFWPRLEVFTFHVKNGYFRYQKRK